MLLAADRIWPGCSLGLHDIRRNHCCPAALECLYILLIFKVLLLCPDIAWVAHFSHVSRVNRRAYSAVRFFFSVWRGWCGAVGAGSASLASAGVS